MTRIGIFDYGAGNLHSLVKAIAGDDRDISVETDLRAAMKADCLVLPGVGAFGAAVDAMDTAQADLRAALTDGLPCVGICLGMQLLFDASEESPRSEEHTSELQSHVNLVCRLLLEKKKNIKRRRADRIKKKNKTRQD